MDSGICKKTERIVLTHTHTIFFMTSGAESPLNVYSGGAEPLFSAVSRSLAFPGAGVVSASRIFVRLHTVFPGRRYEFVVPLRPRMDVNFATIVKLVSRGSMVV